MSEKDKAETAQPSDLMGLSRLVRSDECKPLTAPPNAENVAPGAPAACPLCNGGPLNGHVAGCAMLAEDLPIELRDDGEICDKCGQSMRLHAADPRVPCPCAPISLPPVEVTVRHEFDSESPSQDCSCGWRAPDADRETIPAAEAAWKKHLVSLGIQFIPFDRAHISVPMPILDHILRELQAIRRELSVRNAIAAGGGYPEGD